MSDYLLASDDEKARLQLQARVWQAEAEILLDKIKVQSGWNCAELGCGAMGILKPLSQRIGTEGHIVGVERDPTHLQAVRDYVVDEGLTNVEIIEGDVHRTGLTPNSFDLVHERFLLPYVQANDVLQEMIALTRPGGIIVLQETDDSSWHYYPQTPKWLQFREVLKAAFSVRGDINIGRRIFHLARQAGLQHVQIRAAALALQDNHPYMRLPFMAIAALRPVILQNGLASESELDDYLADLDQLLLNPDTYAVMFTLIQVWGYKPEK